MEDGGAFRSTKIEWYDPFKRRYLSIDRPIDWFEARIVCPWIELLFVILFTGKYNYSHNPSRCNLDHLHDGIGLWRILSPASFWFVAKISITTWQSLPHSQDFSRNWSYDATGRSYDWATCCCQVQATIWKKRWGLCNNCRRPRRYWCNQLATADLVSRPHFRKNNGISRQSARWVPRKFFSSTTMIMMKIDWKISWHCKQELRSDSQTRSPRNVLMIRARGCIANLLILLSWEIRIRMV